MDPIDSTPAGRSMPVSPRHPWNTEFEISVTAVGIEILVKLSHPRKAALPIDETEVEARSTVASFPQPLKALAPMLVSHLKALHRRVRNTSNRYGPQAR